MHVNTHFPHSLCFSFFNQLLVVGCVGYVQTSQLCWLGAQPCVHSDPLVCFYSPVHDEDEQKRLLVTVWNRAGDSR